LTTTGFRYGSISFCRLVTFCTGKIQVGVVILFGCVRRVIMIKLTYYFGIFIDIMTYEGVVCCNSRSECIMGVHAPDINYTRYATVTK